MPGDIRSIMRQRAQCESVFVRILALRQQLSNEVTTANVVHQIAEFHAAKRVVAQVLDDGAAIGVTVGLLELVLRELRKSLQKKWAELISPHQVDDFLVGEHGVGKRTTGAQEHDQKDCHQADTPWAPAIGSSTLRKSRPNLVSEFIDKLLRFLHSFLVEGRTDQDFFLSH